LIKRKYKSVKDGYKYIEVKIEKTVARISLNRPERHNALILEMIAELDQALDEISGRNDLLFMVLSGNGRSFCAGADLNWFYGSDENNQEENAARYKHLADLLLKLHQLPLITIACVRGNVFGGGIGLMAACDFVLAEANTRFMFSEVKLGLLPATILPFVAKRLSVQNLRKWILTGSLFYAPEAHQAGLADILYEEDQLEKTLSEFLNSFDSGAPSAVKRAKNTINQVTSGAIGVNDTGLTAVILAEALSSPDGQEGIQAFLEKRKPNYSLIPNPSPKEKGAGATNSENLNI
jgi:methylglutaconyl-CoA hydratase